MRISISLDDRSNDLPGCRRLGQRVGERRFPVVSPGHGAGIRRRVFLTAGGRAADGASDRL